MAARASIGQVLPGDAELLAATVRESDRMEIMRAEGRPPLPAIRDSISFSTLTWSARSPKGQLLFIAGVCPAGPGRAVPWLIGTTTVDREKKAFMRAAKSILREMRSLGTLINFVDAKNARSIEWLKRLGFTVLDEPVPMGPMGAPFYPFIMRTT